MTDNSSATQDQAGIPWRSRRSSGSLGSTERGSTYAAMIEAFRLLQDRFAAATPPDHVMAGLTVEFQDLARRLAGFAAAEVDRWDGSRTDLPGRGVAGLPPYVIEEELPNGVRGRVTFGRAHLGGNGVTHGGVLPLLFDDLFGQLAGRVYGTVNRTAYLTVNYRRVVLIDVPVRFEATMDRSDGRKRWGSARLYDADDQLATEVDTLLIELRQGQR